MSLSEIQAFGDASKKYQPTIYDGTVSFDGDYNKSDTGQGGLYAKLIAGTAITLDLLTDGSHGGSGNGYTGTVYLDKISIGTEVNGIVSFSATAKFSGAITATTTA